MLELTIHSVSGVVHTSRVFVLLEFVMRALVVASWVALSLTFVVHFILIGMAVSYVDEGYGLMPELAGVIACVLFVFQLYYADYIDYLEAEYL